MDDFDDGDYVDMDNDWLYVEDEYDLADELAENAIPDPGYMGTAAEIAMESYEWDFYGYHEDLEYGEDPYWDAADPKPMVTPATRGTKAGAKRKRNLETLPASKRQKLAPVTRESQPVIYCSRNARQALQNSAAPAVQAGKPFALLPDWRQRFKDADGLVRNKKMPAAMAKAAYEEQTEVDDGEEEEAVEEALAQEESRPADDAEGGEQEEWKSEEEDEGDENDIDIDPEKLQTILAQRLAEAGISGEEESLFLQSFNDMLSGQGKGEAAAALLEKAQSGSGHKRKADSAVGLQPEQKKGKQARSGK